jgi:hypothetical protein
MKLLDSRICYLGDVDATSSCDGEFDFAGQVYQTR